MRAARRLSFLATLVAVLLSAGCASNPEQLRANEAAVSSADQTDDQRRARIRLQLAVGYFEQGQIQTALEELRLALQADSKLADAYSMRGLIYMDLKETRLAEENLLQALRLLPNAPDYNNNYGWFLCQNGREKQSIAYFEAALKSRAYASPEKALHNAGVCSLRLNDVRSAERYFSQAFELDPANVSVNVNLARIYYAQRQDERARFHIGRALKADAMTAEALWLAIKVERRLGDRAAESSLANQLRRRHPASPEFSAYQRGAFDE